MDLEPIYDAKTHYRAPLDTHLFQIDGAEVKGESSQYRLCMNKKDTGEVSLQFQSETTQQNPGPEPVKLAITPNSGLNWVKTTNPGGSHCMKILRKTGTLLVCFKNKQGAIQFVRAYRHVMPGAPLTPERDDSSNGAPKWWFLVRNETTSTKDFDQYWAKASQRDMIQKCKEDINDFNFFWPIDMSSCWEGCPLNRSRLLAMKDKVEKRSRFRDINGILHKGFYGQRRDQNLAKAFKELEEKLTKELDGELQTTVEEAFEHCIVM